MQLFSRFTPGPNHRERAVTSSSRPMQEFRDPLPDRTTDNLHVALADGARDRFLR